MTEPTILPPEEHAAMIGLARDFLASLEPMLIAQRGVAEWMTLSGEQRQALTINFALQAILQPSAWHAESLSLDNSAYAIASAIGAIGAEISEQQSGILVRNIINGYTAGRMEGIAARMQFTTFGRAN